MSYRIQARGRWEGCEWFNSGNDGTTQEFSTEMDAQKAIDEQPDRNTVEYRIVTSREAQDYEGV